MLLTPAVPIAPPRIEDERPTGALREAVLAYTVPQDLIGLPACVLPNGMQLTGPPGAEALLLSVASIARGGVTCPKRGAGRGNRAPHSSEVHP